MTYETAVGGFVFIRYCGNIKPLQWRHIYTSHGRIQPRRHYCANRYSHLDIHLCL